MTDREALPIKGSVCAGRHLPLIAHKPSRYYYFLVTQYNQSPFFVILITITAFLQKLQQC